LPPRTARRITPIPVRGGFPRTFRGSVSSPSGSAELFTFGSPPLSPFPATLTGILQLIEKAAALSPVFATLTSRVKHKSFVCHSYRKHPGWGGTQRPPDQALSPAGFVSRLATGWADATHTRAEAPPRADSAQSSPNGAVSCKESHCRSHGAGWAKAKGQSPCWP
jgi:hypothetical protein